ncbi:MAG: glycerol-3-phosphate dehydrogenase/oxidase [Nanoarchaeota archaeon]|nr:glycerol-3-phosphate dehydrogenase/oxidase [Nanoarchaeota archaeon]
MKRDLEGMSRKEYEILVIGGGINGAATAHDAALRGLKVALIEKNDFGWATTSATSKLAHGGLRYLKNFELSLVRESLRERRILARIAPHLVYPIPFMIPLYKAGNKKVKIKLGMMLYDLLSYDKKWAEHEEQKIPSHKILSPGEAIKEEPRILTEGLTGAAKYYDCQILSPERLCLEFILTAAGNKADAANYAEAEKIIIADNKARGAIVRDNTNGKKYEIKSDIIVNATGPWLDKMIKTYDERHEPMIRGTKGIHIVIPKICNNAVVLATKEGRNFFMIPWRGYSLIGTTDTDFNGDLENVYANEKDILGLIKETNETYNSNLSIKDVAFSYAGVRPLIKEEGRETEVSRKYEARESNGIIHIAGGKLTTARGMAEKTVDLIVKKLGKKAGCKTEETPLHGSTISHAKYLKQHLNSRKDKKITEPLMHLYGSKYGEVLKLAENDEVKAQTLYAMEEEMALTLEDVMLRRTGIATTGYPPISLTLRVFKMMSSYYSWDKAKKEEEIKKLEERLKIRKW